MRARRGARWSVVALAMAVAAPAAVEAQVAIRVDWNVGHQNVRTQGTWSNAPIRGRAARGVVVPQATAGFVPVRGVRVPPGHRPAPGECRLWYPGVPPGQQPPPRRCTALRGAFHPGVVIVTRQGVVRPTWDGGGVYAPYDYRDRYDRWDYDRWDDDRWDDRRDDDRWDGGRRDEARRDHDRYDRNGRRDRLRRGNPGRGRGNG